MSTERWKAWISAQVGSERGRQAVVARAIGVAPGTVNRWVNEGAQPAAEQCRAIAEYFGVPVLRVFVEAGYLTDADAGIAAPNVLAAIRQDPSLLPEAKGHLTRQYGLLLRVQSDDLSDRRARKTGRPTRKVARDGGQEPSDHDPV